MAKVYTRGGDGGETSLCSGERVSKRCARIEACGAVDELQAALGLARALARREDAKEALLGLQRALAEAMAELATAGGTPRIGEGDVEAMERAIDAFSADAPAAFSFQIPGDSAGSAALHVARTVARRAERAVLAGIDEGWATAALRAFFNRVSDLCYALARCEDGAGKEDR